MSFDRLSDTLIELIGISSTSGHEELVRVYIEQKLIALGMDKQVEKSGNLLATLSGTGQPLLLNAHMDRVPPGRGHIPVVRDGILYSDGTTNLGADDAAGIAIILETLTCIAEQKLPHPPIVTLFTVQEEAGLCGANGFDPTPWNISSGIVFDNAFEAGVVVSEGAAYEAFDITLTGRTGHPGKDLSQTSNVVEIFRQAQYPHGSLANDQTRILIGTIEGGSARNAIPDHLTIQGELRSFEPAEIREGYMQAIKEAFSEAAEKLNGKAEVRFTSHSKGYKLELDEPLLKTYAQVLEERGTQLQTRSTFIGSDTSGFRPQVQAFTLSTGVVNEHSFEEYVPLQPLEQIVQDTLRLLEKLAR
ncbi:MAG TPA: M20/M25/M40 family metallo-hydrolase [Ktedonobacteraceae bacterium]|nr:M20/M25/M40 family metallo-hydrolase [Ktedonobacteraceae bacterium]